MAVAYIPKNLYDTESSKVITDIFFCGYAPSGVSRPLDTSNSANSLMTNHWVMYCAISPTLSVRFDPAPDANGRLALIISSKNYVQTANSVKNVSLTPADGLTVGNLIDHIVSSRYQQYQFNPNGQGCRYWLSCLATLLRSAGYVTNDAEVKAAQETLEVVWKRGGLLAPAAQQSDIGAGTFF